jgi:hypothetical protein
MSSTALAIVRASARNGTRVAPPQLDDERELGLPLA